LKFRRNNPWIIAVIGGATSAIIAGVILFYLFEYREKRISRTILITSVNNADGLVEKDMIEDGLSIYKDVLKKVSEENESELYGHIKHMEGFCYYRLAFVRNKEMNLTRAIHAFEEALKIRTLEKYPIDYAKTKNNLGIAYCEFSDVRDKETNLIRAIHAFEETLKIITIDIDSVGYASTQSNLGAAYTSLSGVLGREENLRNAIKAYE
jgi:tetratricopeptide (TPR) repeat protein